MINKIREYIEKNRMIEVGDKIVVGVSGGADSVCLLLLLNELTQELNFEIVPVHINHNLRGEESNRDEIFVQNLCQKYKMNLRSIHVDVEMVSKNDKMSTEEAGRIVRRKELTRVLEEEGAKRIALGHHRDDNVETSLMNFARGTALSGLAGIAPVTGVFIRPLLCVSRSEIESYLKGKGQKYCIDATNLENVYTRNRVRNQVLPQLEEIFHCKVKENMADAVEFLREVSNYLESDYDEAFKEISLRSNRGLILKDAKLLAYPDFMRKEICLKACKLESGQEQGFTKKHLESIQKLFKYQVGRSVDLPHNIKAERVYQGVEVYSLENVEQIEEGNCIELTIPGKTMLADGRVIRCQIMEYSETQIYEDSDYTKYFDYDIIEDKLFVDSIQLQDKIYINSNGERQSLNKFCKNQKIPQSERTQILNIRGESCIYWIVDYRRAYLAKLSGATKKIIKIQIGGEKNGRKS